MLGLSGFKKIVDKLFSAKSNSIQESVVFFLLFLWVGIAFYSAHLTSKPDDGLIQMIQSQRGWMWGCCMFSTSIPLMVFFEKPIWFWDYLKNHPRFKILLLWTWLFSGAWSFVLSFLSGTALLVCYALAAIFEQRKDLREERARLRLATLGRNEINRRKEQEESLRLKKRLNFKIKKARFNTPNSISKKRL